MIHYRFLPPVAACRPIPALVAAGTLILLAACATPPAPEGAAGTAESPATALPPPVAATQPATSPSAADRAALTPRRPDTEATMDAAARSLPTVQPASTDPMAATIQLGGSLAPVEEVDAVVSDSQPPEVNVVVQGYLPDGCTQIKDISQRFDPAAVTFFVTITTSRPPGMACIQVITPFNETIPLDVTGVGPGTYIVDVNGVADAFELE
jgi:hypothetical protein